MRRAVAFAFVLAVGCALGFLFGRSAGSAVPPRTSQPVALDSEIFMFNVDSPGAASSKHLFRPFKYQVGDKIVKLAEPPADPSNVWVVKLDNGRVLVYCSRVPSNETP